MLEKQKMMPKHRGAYFSDDAINAGNVLLSAKTGDMRLYWLVDPNTDLVSGTRYFTYGGAESIAAGEAVSEFALNKNIDEAIKFGPQNNKSIDSDKVSSIQDSIKNMMLEYPRLKQSAVNLKQTQKNIEVNKLDEMWLSATKTSQIEIIERVLDLKVRPGLVQDGGNVTVVDIADGKTLMLEYQGACGSCPSSTGSTLAFIERTLKSLIYKNISVHPTAK